MNAINVFGSTHLNCYLHQSHTTPNTALDAMQIVYYALAAAFAALS
jgi:hypothetical protein